MVLRPSLTLACLGEHGPGMHGGAAAHSARRWCHRSDETDAGGRSPSLVMVLGLIEMWKHVLEGNDGV